MTKQGQRKQEAELENGSSQLEEYERIFLRFQISKIENVTNAHRPLRVPVLEQKAHRTSVHDGFNKILTFPIISASCSFLRAQRC